MARQLTLKQLLEDPVYAKWFRLVPKVRPLGSSPPWVIYVKRKKKSPWARGLAQSYEQALAFVDKHLDDYYDIVISARRDEYKPPVVKKEGKRYYWPTPPKHRWCPFCRRPTHFKYFEHHHAFSGLKIQPIPYIKRCSVCGVKSDFIPEFSSRLRSRWAA